MNIALENVSSCTKRLKIEVPAKTVEEELERVTLHFQKASKIKGFRPGKAPLSLIEKYYGQNIEEEAKNNLVPKAFRQAVKEKNLKIVSQPEIEDLNFRRGISMSFSTVVDLAPEFSLPSYKGIQVKKGDTEVKAEDVDSVIENVRKQFADFKDIPDRPIAKGDFAVITYNGVVEDKPITELVESAGTIAEGKNFWLWINDEKGFFIPDFATQLIGLKAGDEKTVNITFPEDYHHEILRKKQATYQVSIHQIKEQILPDFDDALAQKAAQINAEELKQNVQDNLKLQKEHQDRQAQTTQILEYLRKNLNFELPESAVKREQQRVIHNIVDENKARGISDEALEEKKHDIFQAAKISAQDRVRIGFILSRIAEEEKIEVTSADISQELHTLSHSYNMSAQDILKRLQQNNGLPNLQEQIMRRKTIDFLLQNAKVE